MISRDVCLSSIYFRFYVKIRPSCLRNPFNYIYFILIIFSPTKFTLTHLASKSAHIIGKVCCHQFTRELCLLIIFYNFITLHLQRLTFSHVISTEYVTIALRNFTTENINPSDTLNNVLKFPLELRHNNTAEKKYEA